MLVYNATKSRFVDDVYRNEIDQKILSAMQRRLGRSVGPKEIESWINSMQFMYKILNDPEIPDDSGVAIEYSIPMTAKRIDFILSGRDGRNRDTAIIIELKQWKEAHQTDKDGIVRTVVGGGERETSHPSYQAWSYAELLTDFNAEIQKGEITLAPCAYLHNCESGTVIKDPFYDEYTSKAPPFLKQDAQKLNEFIKGFIKQGDSGNIMYRIDHGKIKPSKNLADSLVSMLAGNSEFVLIDDQKLVYETAIKLANQSAQGKKNVFIVEGGPGTGKSVVAINLLVELTSQNLLTQYVSKNAAPRAVYAATLEGSLKKKRIGALFQGSGAYTECEPNTFDALIVDEAHRLNEKSGLFSHLGENQVKEIISASRFSIFFIDEDQKVTLKDIGSRDEIRKWAKACGAAVHEIPLQSQFRCNGSDGYLSWLDNVLQVRETANETLEGIDYDFQVFDSPNDLLKQILEKNSVANKGRIVAGYCWDWVSKKYPGKSDIVIPEHNFSMQWNLASDGSLWIIQKDSVREVGCIHTCQGLELDYVGVIIGPDLVVRGGKVFTRPDKRAKTDKSVHGLKSLFKSNRVQAEKTADLIIKNTYRTLMTRGSKGCYIYCTDPETAEYFRRYLSMDLAGESSHVGNFRHEATHAIKIQDEPFGRIPARDVDPYCNAIPLYDLKAAAGAFSQTQQVDPSEMEWVSVPYIAPSKDLFVAQVIGESMNKRIPNGSWCLFKANPGGTREGKIVLVEHRDIHDPEMGGSYTVKRYYSEKCVAGDSWQHARITLKPESTSDQYQEIVLEPSHAGELKIIGELIAVLG